MRIPRALVVVALVGGPGCFSTPGFSGSRDGGGSGDDDARGSGGDAGPGVITPGPVTVGTTQSGGKTVESPYLSLVFENAGWKMPLSLKSKVTSAEELSGGGNGEDGIGFSFFNRYYVKRGGNPAAEAGGHATITVTETGPIRAIVQVSWDGSSPCPGSDLTANLIEFKVYMDGRIARHDVLNMSAAPGCTQPGSVYASVAGNRTLVTKFGPDQSTNLTPNAVSAPVYEPTVAPGWACLEGSGEAVGYSWTVPTETPWTKFELARYASGNITFGFIYNETTAFQSVQYQADTLLAIGQGACADLKTHVLDQYSAPAMLTGATWSPLDAAYLAAEGDVTAQTDVPAGAIFILNDDTSVPSLELNHAALQEGADYVTQPAQSGAPKGAMFYLKRPLMVDDVLSIGGN